MRKLGVLILVLAVIIFAAVIYRMQIGELETSKNTPVQKVQDNSVSEKEQYIFIPYWTIDSEISDIPFDTLIYFGIEGSTNGINTSDEGYRRLGNFTESVGDKEKLLTVRLLNSENNSEILRSESMQNKIISESISIAKEYGFSGIVLDLEMQGLPFESLINRITEFNKFFSSSLEKKNLTFGTLIYGDVYHRIRPYDVKALGEVADRVYVMSYDFSKSRGNPGPNFPLEGAKEYGYDFKTMVSDFKEEVPVSKLTYIFGMFGYEWPVDESGKSTGFGTAKTTLQMERMMTRCVSEASCEVKLDPLSQETKITYTLENVNYVSWFETAKSSEEKINYLEAAGLRSIGWWAYSYF